MKVYAVLLVRPETVIGEKEPEEVILPGDDITVYEVIALPPFEDGAVNEIDACALEAEAVTEVGAVGTVRTGFEV